MTLTSEFQYLGRSEKLSPKSGSYGYYILLYGKTSADEKSGLHTVTIQERIACTTNSSFYNFSSEYYGSVGETEVFRGKKAPSSAWTMGEFSEDGVTYKTGTVIAEGSAVVDASDGLAKEIYLSCTWTMTVDASVNYVPAKGSTGTASAAVTLPAIQRASAVSASDAYIGSTSIIALRNPMSGYAYNLFYRFPDEEDAEEWYEIDMIEYPSSTLIWSVPTDIYERIPNRKNISCVIVCETVSKKTGDVVGVSESFPIRLSVNESENMPTAIVTAGIMGDYSITGSPTRWIKGYSNVVVSTSAEAKNGASIQNIAVTLYGHPVVYGVLATFSRVQSAQVSVKVTDSRGISNTITVEGLELVEYIPLTAVAEAYRESPTSDVVHIAINGNAYQGAFNPDGGSNNQVIVGIASRVFGTDEEFVNVGLASVTPNPSTSTYRASFSGTGFDYDKAYEFQISASDAISTVTKVVPVAKGVPLFDWSEDDFRIHAPLYVKYGRVLGEHLLFSGKSAAEVKLSDSVDNYEYVDIYYHDNNGRDAGLERLYDLNGTEKTFHLALTEASTATSTHIRRTQYTCVGDTITPDVASAGYLYFSGTTVKHTTGTNYIRIARVVGYK